MSSANYFLPSVRRGLASGIEAPAGTARRAQIDVEVHTRARVVGGTGFDTDTITRSFQIYGPGDVLGFHPRIVARTYPEPDVDDMEPNYFPAIDFAQSDFAWRYTPDTARSNGSLQPWIALVVLVAQDRAVAKQFVEGEWTPRFPAPWIRVLDQRTLPDLANAWRWAHVQVADAADNIDAAALQSLLEDEPERAVCRLVCPRRLYPDTHYSAFVVPTFELGRLAARREPAEASVTANTPAWSSQSADPIDLPFYYRWDFRIGEGGDFEELVRRLRPRVLTGVGSQPVDATAPGYGIPGETLIMEGALRPLSVAPAPLASMSTRDAVSQLLQRNLAVGTHRYFMESTLPAPGPVNELEVDVLRDGRSVRVGFTTEAPCTARVDYGETDAYGEFESQAGYRRDHSLTLTDLEPLASYHFRVSATAQDGTTDTSGDGSFTLPEQLWVTPPIYGRWHKGDAELEGAQPENWLQSLNLEPSHRIAAGLGAAVVRQHQEDLMASAWEQLGQVEGANEILRAAQLGVEVGKGLHRRLERMDVETMLRVAGPAYPRVLADPAASAPAALPAHIAEISFLPRSATQPALRRLTKPRGAIRKRQGLDRRLPVSAAASAGMLERLAGRTLQAAGPHPTPGGTPSLGRVTALFHDAHGYAADVAGPQPFDENAIGSEWLDAVASGDPFRGGGQISTTEADELVSGSSVTAANSGAVIDAWLNTPPVDPDNLNNTRTPQNRDFLDGIRSTALQTLWPEQTIPRRTRLRLGMRQADMRALSSKRGDADTLDEIVASPAFPQPMYEPLQELSQEYLLPGSSAIPPNTVALLETNRRFVESYLVGCNHEFAAELLWRRYPTDQRGSYFRQFWDVQEYVPKPGELTADGELLEVVRDRLRDVSRIHTWGDRALGHNPAAPPSGADELFLLIRGDLLRRHPGAVIYAVESIPESPGSSNFVPGLGEYVTGYAEPIVHQDRVITPIFSDFKGMLQPDINLLGFRLPAGMSVADAVDTGSGGSHGIYFVFEERVSELRFGLDLSAPAQFLTWNDLSWEHFDFGLQGSEGRDVDAGTLVSTPQDNAGRTWDEDTSSATLACLTVQRPVRVLVHASQMLHSDHSQPA